MWQLAVLFADALAGTKWFKAGTHNYMSPMVVRLARACRGGDISAMCEMAGVLRERCDPNIIALLDCYEAEPTQEHEAATRTYVKGNDMAAGYMMWLVRAALHGDAHTADQLEQWPLYKELAYIPYDMMIGKRRSPVKIWNSSSLYKLGFIDVPRKYTDCSLRYDTGKKVFELSYVSSYYPPDEDGFGAEWEYDSIYFDEFFRRLPAEP